MGWTSYHADYYYRNGTVNRKAECDAYFCAGLNRGYYEIVKSQMVGSTYYAAVKPLKRYGSEKDTEGNRTVEDVPTEDQHVYAFVILTSVDMNCYYNFSYKVMSEDMGPGDCECPDSILELLSPTGDQYATEWRKRCREMNSQKKVLKKLATGAQISINVNGDTRILTRCYPYGKPTPKWVDWEALLIYSPKQIINYGFTVLEPGK